MMPNSPIMVDQTLSKQRKQCLKIILDFKNTVSYTASVDTETPFDTAL